MSVRKVDDGSKKPWLCNVRPNSSNGKRIRKRFATKCQALAYEKFVLEETNDKPWLGEKNQTRILLDMIN